MASGDPAPVGPDVSVSLGPLRLASPLVAASGTVGSVWEFARVADPSAYGAMTAKSVSADPWSGRPAPRLAAASATGMLNGIGIQNPGVERWVRETGPKLWRVGTEVWGSAVGRAPEEYAGVAVAIASTACTAVEINLSCPNLEDGRMIALDPDRSARVVEAVRAAVDVPIGAKLSPNAEDVVSVATACAEAGTDWITLTNTVWGAGIDIETRRPSLAAGVGGYSGPPLKAIALRCVMEVADARPDIPILGCGGVTRGDDVVEFLLAGASAVGIGTVHFAEPRAGSRILSELVSWCVAHGVDHVQDLQRAREPW
jgi:dihydroorotate dehydrogenase (NAD+) catalytic subunit